MKNCNKKIIQFIATAFLLVGCDSNINSSNSSLTSSSGFSNTTSQENCYVITWKNYDGTVLEVDVNVKEGVLPTYDGATPIKPDDSEYTYTWNGWDNEVVPATNNKTYTATYTSTKIKTEEDILNEKYAKKPIISEDGKMVKYGLYPQTYVKDDSLIFSLNELKSSVSDNGWYLFKDNYYVKVYAKPYQGNTTFNDGKPIFAKKEYWFKCEPINWNIISKNNNEYTIVSSTLLDVKPFYVYSNLYPRTIDEKTVYHNNYEYSDIRSWLNDDFYKSAFRLGNKHIQDTDVDNSLSTTSNIYKNPYACENTIDKVFLLSYKDYFSDNIFSDNESRKCKASDYTLATGAYTIADSVGIYWSRSPYYFNDDNHTKVDVVNDYGKNGACYVGDTNKCVRPALTITIE